MKALALSGVVALCVVACNRPDSAIFGPDAPDVAEGGGGGTDANPSGGSEASGGSSANGGSGAQPGAGTDAGGTSTAGTDAGGGTTSGGSGGTAGEVTDPGGAGEGMGGSGTPPDPPDPVCGNGIIEKGEQCDDAGKAGMDGCQDCQVRCEHFGAGTVKSDDHHCYRGFDQANYEGAVRACADRGAHLVTITSAAENQVVGQLVNSSKFIGASEDVGIMVQGQGVYGWVTKEPLNYSNWAQGEPDQDDFSCSGWGNQRCYEHCVVMNGQSTWEDRRCDQADGYVCEWEPAVGAP